METSNESQNIEEIQKNIAIERLRQAPANLSISFGSQGEFMQRDELIKEIEIGSEMGKNIVNIQLEYLKAFKRGFLDSDD